MDDDNKKGFRIQFSGTSHLVTVRTSKKKWQLTFPATSKTWNHVMVTWSEATGILYYRNGLLMTTSVHFEVVENAPSGTQLRIGGPPGYGHIEGFMFRLEIFNRQLEQYAVENVYRFSKYYHYHCLLTN